MSKRPKLQLPELWRSAKYVQWPSSYPSPVVRVPFPDGSHDFRRITPLPSESEYDTFLRCIEYRDARGIEQWGEQPWMEVITVGRRSVVKHRAVTDAPVTGVCHSVHPRGTRMWVAVWSELHRDGIRYRRTKTFSYGTPRSQYSDSEQAKAAAIARRQKEEVLWYSERDSAGVD